MKPKSLYRTYSAQNIKNNNKKNNNSKLASSNHIESIFCNSNEDTDNKFNLVNYYDKMLFHIELSKEKLENQLGKAVKELNAKEVKIYQILKFSLERFKNEITKYEEEYNSASCRSKEIEENINQNRVLEIDLYNSTFMTLEDCNSHYNELTIIRNQVINQIDQMREIEISHPKEYKFMQEEFQLENELKTLRIKVKENKETKKEKLKQQKEMQSEREELLKEIVSIESFTQLVFNKDSTKINNNKETINENNIDISVNAGSTLLNHMNEVIKVLYSKEYNEKNKDMLIIALEKSILKTKMDLMKVKKRKTDEMTQLEKQIKDMSIDINNKANKQNINQLQLKLNQLNTNCNLISKYINQFEYIFNKHLSFVSKYKEKEITLIRSIFRKEILSTVLSLQENKTFKLLYDSIEKEPRQDQTIVTNLKNESRIRAINIRINQLNQSILSIEEEVSKLTLENNTMTDQTASLNKEIEQKNNNLKVNLETLGEEKFNLYIESNESIVKEMKKIYGNKVLSKVLKTQKLKLVESILDDHLSKKEKINESIGFIIQYNKTVSSYQSIIESLEEVYHDYYQRYEKGLEIQRTLLIEKKITDESNKDLKVKIESILRDHMKILKKEKQRLQTEFNTKYNLDKVRTIDKKIQKLIVEKRSMMNEYNTINRELNEIDNKEQCDKETSTTNVHNNYSTALSIQSNKDRGKASSYSLMLSNKVYNPFEATQQKKTEDNIVMSVNNLSKKYIADFNKSNSTSQLIISSKHNPKQIKSSNNLLMNTNKSDNNLIPNNNFEYKEKTPQETHLNKLKPLLSGLSLYMKFDNKIINSKLNQFDPLKAENYPPESCGYALRYFKLNDTFNEINIKKSSHSSRSESKITIKSLLDVFSYNPQTTLRNINNYNSMKKNKTIKARFNETVYIPFTLVLRDKRLNLIANNDLIYNSFAISIRELINTKLNIANK